MAISSAICKVSKELLTGTHNFTASTWKHI